MLLQGLVNYEKAWREWRRENVELRMMNVELKNEVIPCSLSADGQAFSIPPVQIQVKSLKLC